MVAVKAPQHLQTTPQKDLDSAVGAAVYEYALIRRSVDGGDPVRFPAKGWIAGNAADLAGFCERIALSDHLLEQAADAMEGEIRAVAAELRRKLQFGTGLSAIAAALHQEDNEQTTTMGAAIVANAFLFQTALGGQTLRTRDGSRSVTVQAPNPTASRALVRIHWQEILEVNYYPIFDIANQVMGCIPDHTAPGTVIEPLSLLSSELARYGVTSTGDMAGQMFGRLITDRKFLATFYTLPSSAALLAELAVARLDTGPNTDTGWANIDKPNALRVADLACGTGALLTAAYQRILARARRAGLDDEALHPAMMEDALIGADIMPAAVHLTAMLLSSVFPAKPFSDTSIYLMPYGDSGVGPEIGSLELLEHGRQVPLLLRSEQVSGSGTEQTRTVIDHGDADLVIMNPPFTRSTGHEAEKKGVPVPAFAGFDTPKQEQRLMSKQLTAIGKKLAGSQATGVVVAGHGNAGLGSNFLDLAHVKVRPGGAIAFVLPFTIVSGDAWAKARKLLATGYRNICVLAVATHGNTDRAFSADTGMAEVLIIADRRQPEDTAGEDVVLYVNLVRRPGSVAEGVEIARSITRIPTEPTVGPLRVGEAHAGFFVRSSLGYGGCAGVVEMDLAAFGQAVIGGKLHLPQAGGMDDVAICRLGDLGERGKYHMDINGGPPSPGKPDRGPFSVEELGGDWQAATYPMLWGHDHRRETKMSVVPDSQGRVKPGLEHKAAEVWASASRLHFSRDFQLNSQPLAACLIPEAKKCIGGRAWPSFASAKAAWEKPLVLWANTTFGLVSWWWIGTRQQEGRAMVTISRLPELPVLDVRRLSEAQIVKAEAIFDDFEGRDFLPANEAYRDEARQALDEAILFDLLNVHQGDADRRKEILDAVETLRNQWCREPSVHGGQSTGLGIDKP